MTKNKRINPEDYEAAFLFKHFVASCHQQESKFHMPNRDNIMKETQEDNTDEKYKKSVSSGKEEASVMHNASMYKGDDAEIFRIVPEPWEDQQSSSYQSKNEAYIDESRMRNQDRSQEYSEGNAPFKDTAEGDSWAESKDSNFTDGSENTVSTASVVSGKKNTSADMEKKTEKKHVASKELEHSDTYASDANIAGFICVYCREKFVIKKELVDHLLEAHALKE